MDNSVYQAPKADIQVAEIEQKQHFKYFNFRGRMNRLKYLQLAYFLPSIIFFGYIFVIYLIVYLDYRDPFEDRRSYGLDIVLWIGILVILISAVINGVWLSIQRAHDIGHRGFVALTSLIPLIGLPLIIMPGEQHKNAYGEEPVENSGLVKITGWLGIAGVALYYFLVFVLGLLWLERFI